MGDGRSMPRCRGCCYVTWRAWEVSKCWRHGAGTYLGPRAPSDGRPHRRCSPVAVVVHVAIAVITAVLAVAIADVCPQRPRGCQTAAAEIMAVSRVAT